MAEDNSDEDCPQLVPLPPAPARSKIPITIITGFLGKLVFNSSNGVHVIFKNLCGCVLTYLLATGGDVLSFVLLLLVNNNGHHNNVCLLRLLHNYLHSNHAPMCAM